MSPKFTAADAGDLAERDSEHTRKLVSISRVCTDLPDLLDRQLRAGSKVASWMAFFCDHFGRVVGCGSKPEVRRVAARRVITTVEDERTFWHIPDPQSVHQTMNLDVSAAATTYSDLAIPLGDVLTNPVPTLRLDIRADALFEPKQQAGRFDFSKGADKGWFTFADHGRVHAVLIKKSLVGGEAPRIRATRDRR